MSVFENLEPKAVWQYFEEILEVPRPSKKEEKIIAFLLDFTKKNSIEAHKDKIGNILMRKPATKGKENLETVILQSHIDMVCEKNSDVDFDFEKDAIKARIDGEWVKATGTTLGADDGIGIATQMAILTATDIEHGPIECLFTVDEETGLTGAHELQPKFMKGKILINLDSEDEGELFIGCAGGKDTVANFKYKTRRTPKKNLAYEIKISGLKGGHSGDDINKGLGNSIKLLTLILNEANERFNMLVSKFEGGNLRNAIPREAEAVVLIRPKHEKQFLDFVNTEAEKLKKEYSFTEPKLSIKIETCKKPKQSLKKGFQRRFLKALLACPHGVYTMSQKMPGMVETSTNLAAVKFKKKNTIEITTSQRSDSAVFINEIAATVKSVFNLANADAKHNSGYPGWSPNPDSSIMKLTAESYEKLFNEKPIVRSIHAGLECGLFLEKYPDLDMISFGPTIRQVHSPDERLEIKTVDKFWKLLIEVLKNIPEKK